MRTCYSIMKGEIDGNFHFTGRWKYGTNPIFSRDPDNATHFTLRKEAEDYNRQRQLNGVVVEVNFCGN